MRMAKIAFIGLGNMGGGMAPNLAKAGHEVRAFDLSEEALARAVEQGCARAAIGRRSGAEAPRRSSPCCPPASMSLESIAASVFGKAPTSAHPDRLLDDRRRHRARDRGGSGGAGLSRWSTRRSRAGSPRPTAGTLTFMVGGSRRGVRARQPILENDGQGGDPRRRRRVPARRRRSATTCCSARR